MSERNENIVRLWNENRSSLYIARELGITRNMVIGVVTRMRKKGRITRAKLNGRVACGNMNRKPTLRKGVASVRSNAVSMPKLFQRDPQQPEKDIEGGIPFMSLDHGQCKYPVGRSGDQHMFCGEPRRDIDTSYCGVHHAACHREKRRLSAEDLRKLQKGYAMKQWLHGSDAAHRKAGSL